VYVGSGAGDVRDEPLARKAIQGLAYGNRTGADLLRERSIDEPRTGCEFTGFEFASDRPIGSLGVIFLHGCSAQGTLDEGSRNLVTKAWPDVCVTSSPATEDWKFTLKIADCQSQCHLASLQC